MMTYTFFVAGVGIEVEATAATEREAHAIAWNCLSDSRQNAAAYLDCVDSRPVTPGPPRLGGQSLEQAV